MWEKCELRCNAVASRTVHSSSEPAAAPGRRDVGFGTAWGVVLIIVRLGETRVHPQKMVYLPISIPQIYAFTVAASQRQCPGAEMLGLEQLGPLF